MFRDALSGLLLALSTYTTVPMPQRPFRPESLRYTLAFFPLSGLLIGLLHLPGLLLLHWLGASPALLACYSPALLAGLSGGIHLDGLADASDAIFSRRSRNEMLTIMKDPHCGPMAVVVLIFTIAGECLLFLSLYSLWTSLPQRLLLALLLTCILVLERVISGYLTLTLPKARRDGMAVSMGTAPSLASRTILLLIGLFFSLLLLLGMGWWGFSLLFLLALCALLFRHYVLRVFNGITGDLAGFLLCMEEVAALALLSLLLQ